LFGIRERGPGCPTFRVRVGVCGAAWLAGAFQDTHVLIGRGRGWVDEVGLNVCVLELGNAVRNA